MVKKIFYILLFWTCFTAIPSSLLANEPSFNSITPTALVTCTAPPPDSLRAISVGSDFATLAWSPVWVGADHTLSLFKKNGLAWDSLYTIPSVTGSQYTIQNLEPGTEYQIFMRTKCPNGDPGTEYSSIEITTFILDLTLLGKTPIDPMVVNCEDINYVTSGYKWIGFRVSHYIGEKKISNLFQVLKLGSSTFQVRRVITDHPLVAANELNVFPTVTEPTVGSIFTITILDRLTGNSDPFIIGYVKVDFGTTTISICHPDTAYWHPHYLYEPLVAMKFNAAPESETDSRSNFNVSFSSTKVQNPFTEHLNVFLPVSNNEYEAFNISLLNSSGVVVLQQDLESNLNQISIPTNSIPLGFYTLRIESNRGIQNFKVIKIK